LEGVEVYRPVFLRQTAAAFTGLFLALAAGTALGQVRPASQQRPPEQQRPADPRPGDRGEAPRGNAKWWEVYKTELRLTPEQASRIDAIFGATFPQLRASVEELNKREEQLSALISANDATEAQVLKQADQIESIRSELSKTRVLMLFRMRRVLSPEQRNKLQELQKAHDRERGGPPPRRE
jgi:Spy/CpxP family protein refolding chaperone